MIFMGIDPGTSGAVAFYRPFDGLLEVVDMPTRKRRSGRLEMDAVGLCRLIRGRDIWCAVLEDVGAMTYVDASGQKRGQGAAHSFAFGKAAGVVVGVLAALDVKTHMVHASVWKSLMHLSRDKDLSRVRAKTLFPKNAEEFARKKDDGRAEAALLAYFAHERFRP